MSPVAVCGSETVGPYEVRKRTPRRRSIADNGRWNRTQTTSLAIGPEVAYAGRRHDETAQCQRARDPTPADAHELAARATAGPCHPARAARRHPRHRGGRGGDGRLAPPDRPVQPGDGPYFRLSPDRGPGTGAADPAAG